jgi:predicted nucleic acid-binding protein
MVDSSAWVEYTRATGSPADARLTALFEAGAPVHTTEVVVMDLLAGARHEAHLSQLERLLSVCKFVPLGGVLDFESAAELYRQCRRQGETIRKMNDCLIAAVAIRADLEVLHADRDFDALARHTALRCVKVA